MKGLRLAWVGIFSCGLMLQDAEAGQLPESGN